MKWYCAPMTLLGIVLVTAVGVVLEPLLRLFPAHYFDDIARAVGTGGGAIMISVVLAPLIEEVVFRWLGIRLLLRWLSPFWAVMVTSAAFGLVHFPNLPQVVNALACGIVLGYVFVVTRSLLSVVVIHSANNALAYLSLAVVGPSGGDLRTMIGNEVVYWIVWAACAALLVGSMTVIIKSNGQKIQIPSSSSPSPHPDEL